jgi:hypothetical protein
LINVVVTDENLHALFLLLRPIAANRFCQTQLGPPVRRLSVTARALICDPPSRIGHKSP